MLHRERRTLATNRTWWPSHITASGSPRTQTPNHGWSTWLPAHRTWWGTQDHHENLGIILVAAFKKWCATPYPVLWQMSTPSFPTPGQKCGIHTPAMYCSQPTNPYWFVWTTQKFRKWQQLHIMYHRCLHQVCDINSSTRQRSSHRRKSFFRTIHMPIFGPHNGFIGSRKRVLQQIVQRVIPNSPI